MIPGRTLIEATPDSLALASARFVRSTVLVPQSVDGDRSIAMIIDPFLGSATFTSTCARGWSMGMAVTATRIQAVIVLGVELDPAVDASTSANFSRMEIDRDASMQLRLQTAESGGNAGRTQAPVCIIFLAPPWGSGFSFQDGLDLRATEPSYFDAIGFFEDLFGGQPSLQLIERRYVIQIHERMNEDSVAALLGQCGIEVLGRKGFEQGAPGTNVGCLVDRGRRCLQRDADRAVV